MVIQVFQGAAVAVAGGALAFIGEKHALENGTGTCYFTGWERGHLGFMIVRPQPKRFTVLTEERYPNAWELIQGLNLGLRDSFDRGFGVHRMGPQRSLFFFRGTPARVHGLQSRTDMLLPRGVNLQWLAGVLPRAVYQGSDQGLVHCIQSALQESLLAGRHQDPGVGMPP